MRAGGAHRGPGRVSAAAAAQLGGAAPVNLYRSLGPRPHAWLCCEASLCTRPMPRHPASDPALPVCGCCTSAPGPPRLKPRPCGSPRRPLRVVYEGMYGTPDLQAAACAAERLLLFGGGSGATPLASLLAALLRQERDREEAGAAGERAGGPGSSLVLRRGGAQRCGLERGWGHRCAAGGAGAAARAAVSGAGGGRAARGGSGGGGTCSTR